MRKVISEFTHLPYNEVILKRTEKGKPYLVNMTHVKSNFFEQHTCIIFNLLHFLSIINIIL